MYQDQYITKLDYPEVAKPVHAQRGFLLKTEFKQPLRPINSRSDSETPIPAPSHHGGLEHTQ